MDSNQINEAVTAKLAELGIVYSAQYVAQTFRDEWECDQWRITFEKRAANYHGPRMAKNCYSTDYFTGLGHRKVPKTQSTFMNSELKNYHRSRHAEVRARYEKPVAPDVAGVLHSLCMDGGAISQSFTDWCDDFGADIDSIKAFNTYQTCERIGREMREFFGSNVVRELAELTSEY